MGSPPPDPRRPARRDYATWSEGHAVHPAEEARQRLHAAGTGPLLRFLVVIVGDRSAPAASLDATIESVALQTWPHLRCVVVGARSRSTDRRVESVLGPGPPGQVVTALLAAADEEFLVLLRAGDTLSRDCLYHAYRCAWRDPAVEVVYWDHDAAPGHGPPSPLFKPAWSPDLLLSFDYVDRAAALRRTRVLLAGGVGGEIDDTDVWSLHLRCTRDLPPDRVDHVARVLSHLSQPRPPAIGVASHAMLAEHVRTLDAGASVAVEGGRPHVRWSLPDPAPHASIIVCTRFNRAQLERSLGSLHLTDYPSFDVVVVDNGDWDGQDREPWYRESFPELSLRVLRWETPFNYSAVNNLGASRATGEVLVFLNDDTEITSPGWLREIVTWLHRPGVGLCGVQLLDHEGRVQHAGAFVGLTGFAGHMFAGMGPADTTMLGPVTAYRDVLAVTGACLGITHRLFAELGGFDERFLLCGSDVALGLGAVRRGLRVICSPFEAPRHAESATRGGYVPEEDVFTSYWPYQPYLLGGDPYLSPNVSRRSTIPELRWPDEPSTREIVSGPLRRTIAVYRQRSDVDESLAMAAACRATIDDRRAVATAHAAAGERRRVRSVTWFLPDLDSPFYGGMNTALRIADHLAAHHGVDNRFAIWGGGPESYVRSGIAAAYPRIAESTMCLYDGQVENISLPESDAAVATLWPTAYRVAQWPRAQRRFYLIQDFEPMFYPAGTMYALAEESYRLGLYGICNTATLLAMYERAYGGRGMSFQPAVDRSLFHPPEVADLDPDRIPTIFVYARPGHPRNCWEMATLALREVKRRLGTRVRIVTAGSWATDDDPEEATVMRHLGLLDLRRTGELYRACDIGLCLTVSRHPSYLPLELMASGVAVVAFDNPHGHWLLRDGENCSLAEQTVSGLADAMERLAVDPGLRRRLAATALRDVDRDHSDWDAAVCPVHAFLCDPDPEAQTAPGSAAGAPATEAGVAVNECAGRSSSPRRG